MKRRKLIIAASVAAVAIVSALAVAAYLISSPSSITNEIPIGFDEISIEESFDPPEEQTEGGVTTYNKVVSVTNTGDTPCYIRVFADFSTSSIRAISSFSYDNGNTYYPADLVMANNYFIKEVSSSANPNKGWIYIQESDNALIGGYYYYTEAIDPGETTPPLFTDVKTDYSLNPGQKTEQYDVIVYAESVQTVTKDGNADTEAPGRYRTVWEEYISGVEN